MRENTDAINETKAYHAQTSSAQEAKYRAQAAEREAKEREKREKAEMHEAIMNILSWKSFQSIWRHGNVLDSDDRASSDSLLTASQVDGIFGSDTGRELSTGT